MTPHELKAEREALGIDQVDFARYLGVSPWTYIRWESPAGKGPPRNRVKQVEDLIEKIKGLTVRLS